MNIIDIAYALTAPVEAVVFFMIFDTFFERRRKFPAWQYIIGICVLTFLFAAVNNIFLYRLGNLVGMIFSAVIISSFFYSTTWKKRIIVPLLIWALFAALEIIVLNFIIYVFNITASIAVNSPAYLLLGIIISKTTGLAICYAIRVKGRSNQFEVDKTYWFLFVFLFLSSAVASFLIFWMLEETNNPEYNFFSVICTIGLYISTFLALYLYERSIRQNQIIDFKERLEQQMRSQIKHMDEIIQKQNELRALRHDMNSHLIALKRYFDTSDIVTGQKYIANLVDQFQNTAPAISTGNNSLDAILSAKKTLAENKGIIFRTEIRIQEKLPIDPKDLAIIFGNALDNAIEACDRLPDNVEKWIELVLKQDATTIFCKITNTAPKKNNLETSKEDKINHGFGLLNIQNALKKYGAIMDIQQKQDQFYFEFSIFY